MKHLWKQTFRGLCVLVCGVAMTACTGSATIVSSACVSDGECDGVPCVNGACALRDAGIMLADTHVADTHVADTHVADTHVADTTQSDACTGDACSTELSCDPGLHICDASCVSNASPETCGERCEPCPSSPNGSPTCTDGSCGVECDPAFSWNDAAQACVQCTPEDTSACGPNSCDPATNTCTNTPRGGLLSCQQCVSDSECQEHVACVPMQFEGTPRQKSFCLPIAGAKPDSTSDCEAPFPNRVARESTNGIVAEFCTLNEELTTCEAFSHFGQQCASPSDCGADGLIDSLCDSINFEIIAACTYPCSSNDECPTTSPFGCTTGTTGTFCGAW